MPYRRRGRDVQHFKDGHWSVKQHCKSIKNADSAIRLLETLDHRGAKK